MEQTAQQLINEIVREQKRIEVTNKIAPETLRQFSKHGIEFYTEEDLKNGNNM